MPSRRNSLGCDQRLHLLPHGSSMDHHVLSAGRDSNPLIPLLHNVSSAMQHASHRSLTQLLPILFHRIFAAELSPFIAVLFNASMSSGYFPVSHEASHLSLRSSRRLIRIYGHACAATGQAQTSPSYADAP